MQLKRPNRHLAAFFCGLTFSLAAVYTTAAPPATYKQSAQLAATKLVSLDPVAQMTLAQQHSFNLLLQNYQDCFLTRVEPSPHNDLPNTVAIDIYEQHNQDCGGDPNTMPRRASYLIDNYGRVFYENIADSTLDLQFQFNEVPVIINDMTQFQHPTKAIFERYGIHLQKVEKRVAGSFVIFYVADTPLLTDTQDKQNTATRQQFFQQLLKANGGWDFMLRSEDGQEYYIEGTKRKIIDPQSY